MLGRDTNWRQGSLLKQEAALALGLIEHADASRQAMLISHDCDLPNEHETTVELIVATVVGELDPQFANARHPRKLHLQFRTADDQTLILSLSHDGKRSVDKRDFAAQGEQAQSTYVLDGDARRVLKQWLAARYARPAFPTAFETRLKKTCGKKSTVEKEIAGILSAVHQHLAGLFIDLDEVRHKELPTDEAYPLRVQVVYHAEQGETARRAAEAAATQLRQLFLQAYGLPEDATEIFLDSCEALADTSITLADLRKIDQWRLEYLSMGAEPREPFMGLGELGT